MGGCEAGAIPLLQRAPFHLPGGPEHEKPLLKHPILVGVDSARVACILPHTALPFCFACPLASCLNFATAPYNFVCRFFLQLSRYNRASCGSLPLRVLGRPIVFPPAAERARTQSEATAVSLHTYLGAPFIPSSYSASLAPPPLQPQQAAVSIAALCSSPPVQICRLLFQTFGFEE